MTEFMALQCVLLVQFAGRWRKGIKILSEFVYC